MFEFTNKTIDEIRNEILSSQGKKMKTQNGTEVAIGNVTNCGIVRLSRPNGNCCFDSNGEFDYAKNIDYGEFWGVLG